MSRSAFAELYSIVFYPPCRILVLPRHSRLNSRVYILKSLSSCNLNQRMKEHSIIRTPFPIFLSQRRQHKAGHISEPSLRWTLSILEFNIGTKDLWHHLRQDLLSCGLILCVQIHAVTWTYFPDWLAIQNTNKMNRQVSSKVLKAWEQPCWIRLCSYNERFARHYPMCLTLLSPMSTNVSA